MRILMIVVATLVLVANTQPASAQRLAGQKTAQSDIPQKGYKNQQVFNYGLCRALGGTAWRCGVRLHYWTNRHPNGRVIY